MGRFKPRPNLGEPFENIIEGFVDIVRDYFSGNREGYQSGLRSAAVKLVESVFEKASENVPIPTPSALRIAALRKIHMLGNSDIKIQHPETLGSVFDDFNRAVHDAIVSVAPVLNFVPQSPSVDLLFLIFNEVLNTVEEHLDKEVLSDPNALERHRSKELMDYDLVRAENVAVRQIAVTARMLAEAFGRVPPDFAAEALDIIGAIQTSQTVRQVTADEQLAAIVERLSAVAAEQPFVPTRH